VIYKSFEHLAYIEYAWSAMKMILLGFTAIARKWWQSAYRLLLLSTVSMLLGCAHVSNNSGSPVQILSKGTVEKLSAPDFLGRLAQSVNLQTASVEKSALSSLGAELSEADIRAARFIKVNTYPQNQNGVVAISYSREKGELNQRQGTRELLSITLQPALLCIDTSAVHNTWQPRMSSGEFSLISFAAGKVSTSLLRNQEEQNRRGNGPMAMIVKINAPNDLHRAQFSFDHQYYVCARSVTLETWKAGTE
jgi:hypothetical protein